MIDMTTGQQHYEMMHNENKIVWPKSKSNFHAHKFYNYNTSMSNGTRVLACFFEGGLAENIIHFMFNIRQTMQMTCMKLHRRHQESHNYAFKQENVVLGAEQSVSPCIAS